MMSRNMPKQTAAERDRNNTLRRLHCILCTLAGDFKTRRLEIHHIVRGNKRLGHWYTLQLCAGHHQGKWTDQAIRVGIKSGRHAFREQYGYDELQLWQRQQVALGLDDSLPPTKILPRRLGGNHGQNNNGLVPRTAGLGLPDRLQPGDTGESAQEGRGPTPAAAQPIESGNR